MGRSCSSCGNWCERHEFSSNQWSRGSRSRCKQCVSGSGGGSSRYSPYGSSPGGGGGYGSSGEVLKLFHGTSWATAQKIQREGFIPSSSGLLGPGVYVARQDKATRFAQDKSRHGGSAGGLVEVLVTIRNPKYVSRNNTSWRSEGHDACRADETSISPNMEWVIADPSQVAVVRISRVSLVGGPAAEPWHTCEWLAVASSTVDTILTLLFASLHAGQTCARSFPDAHTLASHEKSHLPKSTQCPLCGETRFRNMVSAVAHVEGGTCSACLGQDNARRQVYQFAQQHSGMLMLGDRQPMLHLDAYGNAVVPENPYTCPTCKKAFKNLSSQMDHQNAKGHFVSGQASW